MMWMVDCDEHVKDLKIPTGRKLRPLMPRPITASTAAITTTMNCVFSTLPDNPNTIGWGQPTCYELSEYGIQREMNRVPLVSPRWNPTPEQLQALEELYRRGIRTPTAQQIQVIAAKLRRFGKIEGKNVFYWFQNHKARERQKKRRQLELHAGSKLHHADAIDAQLQTGGSRQNIELDHVRKKSTFSNSSTLPQDSVCWHAEWTKLDHRELQQLQAATNEQTCWQLDLSSCMPSQKSGHIVDRNVVSKDNPDQENEKPLNPLDINLLLSSGDDEIRSHVSGVGENPTLLLFPIKSHGSITLHNIEERINEGMEVGMTFTPREFYEFLPSKK